jgi:hypothetical protein
LCSLSAQPHKRDIRDLPVTHVARKYQS